jgi:hypothetical protein
MRLAAPVPSFRTARPALVLLAALVPVILLAAPATAASGRTPTGTSESATAAAGPAAAPAGPHCTLAAGANQPLRCFATFREAISVATRGRVTDAPASAAAAATDPAFAARVERSNATATARTSAVTPAASVLAGIEYANVNFGGSTLSLSTGGSCDNSSDVDFRVPSLPAGWNDRISSFRSFSNCAQQLFRSVNFTGGALTGIVGSLANVGAAANDQASSVTFN